MFASDILLTSGPNVIEVVGRDRVGNAATTQITVVRQTRTQSQIRLVSGNAQAGPISSVLAAPLVVALTNAAGLPVANTAVIFTVKRNDGLVATDGSPVASAVAMTDAQG